jgi:hypothetical protein
VEDPEDFSLKKLKETANWALPGDLDSREVDSEFHIDHDRREGEPGHIPTVLRNIAEEIEYVFCTCYSFADSKHAALITMFILDTYFKNSFDHAPRIKIIGDSMGGKSRLLKLTKNLGYRVKQSVDISEAALFRSVEMFGATYLYDESQDMGQESKAFFNKIWKAGAERDSGGVERCDKDFVPMSFNVYSPMIKSVITGNRDKNDVDNRAFFIHTRRKDGVKLERPNEERLKALRTALHQIKIRVERHGYALDLRSMAGDSEDEFTALETTVDEVANAKRNYPNLYDYKLKEGPLFNRPLDMAIPYYTLAKITGLEKEIIPLCYELKEKAKETDMESIQGRMFRVWLNVAEDPKGAEINEDILNLIYPLKERLFKISSRDVKDRYNDTSRREGEREINTGYVTTMMSGWGFTIKSGAQGKKFVEKDGKFEEVFCRLLEIYGDEDQVVEFYRV